MSLNQGDHNKGGMIAFVFSMAITILFFVYVSFFSGGVDLQEIAEEAAVEQTVAEGGAEEPKKIDVSNVQDPWIPTEDLIAHGQKLYQVNCAMCHGAEGKGDGVAGASLNPKPRNLVEGKWKIGGTRLALYQVLHDGIPGTSMQSYQHLSAVDRWAMVHFIRSITDNKVNDSDSEVAEKAKNLK